MRTLRHSDQRGCTPPLLRKLLWLTLTIGFALLPVADYLSVRSAYLGSSDRFSLLLRGGTAAALGALLLLTGRIRASSVRLAVAALIAMLSASLWLTFDLSTASEWQEQMVLVLKIFYIFIFYAAMRTLSEQDAKSFDRVVCFSLIIYAASIIAGALFSIELFRSYKTGDAAIRSGFKGIIYAQNEATALLVAALGYGLMRVLHGGWTLTALTLIICAAAASVLLGTKGALVGMTGVTAAFFAARDGWLKSAAITIVAVCILSVAFITAYETSDQVRDAIDLTLRYFEHQGNVSSKGGLLTLLLSGRDIKFANMWGELDVLNFVPLLSGGYPINRYIVELDFIDLLLVLGLPALFVYAVELKRCFWLPSKDVAGRFSRYFFLVLILIAVTGGHVLVSAVAGSYLAAVAFSAHRLSQRFHRATETRAKLTAAYTARQAQPSRHGAVRINPL